MREVPYVNLKAQFAHEGEDLKADLDRLMASGMWVGGDVVGELECELAGYLGCADVITVGSGTDALILGMRALGIGPGDEVITPPNSFVASTSAIVHVGATPVFADVLADQNIDPDQIRQKITPRTKAIMPVHLTGRLADMPAILQIAQDHNLLVVEDAAQCIGSHLNGTQAGTFGDIGCFSTHPLKNLNAMGDGGFVTTNTPEVAERVRRLRNNGLADRNTVMEWGVVSRLDSVQAVVLRHRLKALDTLIARRREHAGLYRNLLDDNIVYIPPEVSERFDSYHTFVVQLDRRDALQQHLKDKGIGTAIHYPVPIHLQPAAASMGHQAGDFPMTEKQAGRILSLPINQTLSADDIAYVAETVNGFYAA